MKTIEARSTNWNDKKIVFRATQEIQCLARQGEILSCGKRGKSKLVLEQILILKNRFRYLDKFEKL
ncbi:hypothetical protein LEP1GSC193_1223 [Leptospira alstonii serovar Pingchang str. 80-412]|uniref:Uncharacterized protein n=2 Tax=Leptospira alstonii TaxID=28452 RepID=M6D940_9LEPT|nr:hypothetical protein LEP1GSC194_1347 [Leptospira alstonii serovar Sichuan str. 79601]EQA82467.1 hypothetical protein LEP1GSC193_1223 [Leptospira alstonii serovar Pingchang str. 80-412]